MSRQDEIWASGREPALAEVLSDPIVHLVMRRDGLSEGDVRAAVRLGQARLQLIPKVIDIHPFDRVPLSAR